jgi:hypothetical protein
VSACREVFLFSWFQTQPASCQRTQSFRLTLQRYGLCCCVCVPGGFLFPLGSSDLDSAAQRTLSFSLTLRRYGLYCRASVPGGFLFPLVFIPAFHPFKEPRHSFDVTKIRLSDGPAQGPSFLSRSRRDLDTAWLYTRTHVYIKRCAPRRDPRRPRCRVYAVSLSHQN